MGQDTGLSRIRELAEQWTDEGAPAIAAGTVPGTITEQDTLAGYAAHLTGLVDLTAIRPLKVVVDAGNGMGGHTVPTVFEGLPLDLVPMYFELDGTFPNHEANPLDPKNIVDLQAAYWPKARTSASPSTATPTAASSSTSAARPSPRRRSPPWSRPASWPATAARAPSSTT